MQPPAPPPPPKTGCAAIGLGPHSMTCQDVSLLTLYIVLLPLLALFVRYRALHACGEPLSFRQLLGLAAATQGRRTQSNAWTEELLPAAVGGPELPDQDTQDLPKSLWDGPEYSALEQRLRGWYFQQVGCNLFAPAVCHDMLRWLG